MKKLIILQVLLLSTLCLQAQSERIFHLAPQFGVGWNSFSLVSPSRGNVWFSTEHSPVYRIGIAATLDLPTGNKDWALLFEPSYHTFQHNSITQLNFLSVPIQDRVDINYQSIELPIGVRKSFTLNETIKVFISGAIIIDFNIKNTIDAARIDLVEDEEPYVGFGFDGGIMINEKIHTAIRWYLEKDTLTGNKLYGSKYGGFGLLLGYRIF